MERHRNWSGLLIEPNPLLFQKLIKKNRRSFLLNACLNSKNVTGRYLFDPKPLLGGLVHEMKDSHRKAIKSFYTKIKVQCFPFHSIMLALGRTDVDLLSLDVEGAELGILKTIPFSEIYIDTILIEYYIIGSKRETVGRINYFIAFLGTKGYRLVAIMRRDMYFTKQDKTKKL